MKKYLVSIVVPVYNVEKYLKRCVDSIINQSYNNIEILLVDDGSTDSSGKICDDYLKKDSRIKVIHKQNGGLSDARNFGIDKSTGDYLSFIDSDDWIEKDMIMNLFNSIINEKSDISICRRYRVYDNQEKNVESFQTFPKSCAFNNIDGLNYLMSFCGYDMSVCDKMFKSSLFYDVRFPFGKTCEDSFTTYKLFAKANKISYIDKPLYNYYYRVNSITRNKDVNETVITAAKEQFMFIKDNYPENIYAASSFVITAYMSVYNEFIIRNKICTKINEYKNNSRSFLRNALKNQNISKLKKIQMLIFCLSTTMYKLFYKIMLKRK